MADARLDDIDELDELIAEMEKTNPSLREAREDVRAVHAVIDGMLEARRTAKLSQKKVAKRMGVKQPTISQIECESSDPRISTLQRYARALGGHLEVRFVAPDPLSLRSVPQGGDHQ